MIPGTPASLEGDTGLLMMVISPTEWSKEGQSDKVRSDCLQTNLGAASEAISNLQLPLLTWPGATSGAGTDLSTAY